MTISSTNRKAGPYLGDGVNKVLPFGFVVFTASDVLVVQADALGAETTLALGTNYTVALNADQNASPGGTVTLVTATPVGRTATLTSQVPSLQPLDLTNSGGFYPAVVNKALDRLTVLAQQNSEKIGRAVVVPLSSTGSPTDLLNEILLSVSAANAAATASAGSATASSGSAAAAVGSANAANAAASAAAASAAALDPSLVPHLANDQTFVGVNTFTQPVVVPSAANSNQTVNKGQMDLADAAAIAAVALGGFRGLALSTTGANANVTLSADALMVLNGTGGAAIIAPAVTINSAGSGVNGLDTGVLAVNSWYSVWVIYNGATSAGLLSLSATAPILPAGYTHKARVGWVRTDGTGNKFPLPVRQFGRHVRYAPAAGSNLTDFTAIATASGSIGYTSVSTSSVAPPTANGVGIRLTGNAGSGVGNIGLGGNSTQASLGIPLAAGVLYQAGADVSLESLQGPLYWGIGTAGGFSATMTCTGWDDNL